MLLSQDNKCGICTNKMTRPCLDHNHSTGQIRMLLCHNCNVILGLAKEDKTILSNAISYIEKFS